MLPDALDHAAATVLHHYPISCRGELTALGNHGGFSGARLWRTVDHCLRAWPPDVAFPARLDYVHRLMTMARGAALTFVPRIEPTLDRSSRVEHSGRWWELVEWLPGRADYHDKPTVARLEAACLALARLHRAWESERLPAGPCPAVARRFDALRTWRDLRATGWDPLHEAANDDPLRLLIERAAALLVRWIGAVPAWLLAHTDARPIQPCLCDVWHDHLLFEGDRLTGLVDYGSVKPDHVAVDLARLLGSLVEDDDDAWDIGLAAYRSERPLAPDEAKLARALDRTGVVMGVANWLRWLYIDRRLFEDRAAVGRRLGALVTRVERWG